LWECTLYVIADRTWYMTIVQHSRPLKVLFPVRSARWVSHKNSSKNYSEAINGTTHPWFPSPQANFKWYNNILTKHILEIWYLAVRLASNRKTNKSLQNTPPCIHQSQIWWNLWKISSTFRKQTILCKLCILQKLNYIFWLP